MAAETMRIAVVDNYDSFTYNLVQYLAELGPMPEVFRNDEVLARIGKAHGKTAAQVSLRYLVQLGLCAIPRTATPAHLKENLDVFGFKLSDAEMAELKKLNATNMRVVNPPHAPVWDTP